MKFGVILAIDRIFSDFWSNLMCQSLSNWVDQSRCNFRYLIHIVSSFWSLRDGTFRQNIFCFDSTYCTMACQMVFRKIKLHQENIIYISAFPGLTSRFTFSLALCTLILFSFG